MDPNLMHMFGNLLMGMAKTKPGSVDWQQLFQLPPQTPFDPAAMWEGYKNWLNLMGGVPLAEHRSLQAKYDLLKARCDQQQTTIQALQTMLMAKEGLQESFFENLNQYAEVQGRLVRNLMEGLSGPALPASEKKDAGDG